jgi:hypothetical protein
VPDPEAQEAEYRHEAEVHGTLHQRREGRDTGGVEMEECGGQSDQPYEESH